MPDDANLRRCPTEDEPQGDSPAQVLATDPVWTPHLPWLWACDTTGTGNTVSFYTPDGVTWFRTVGSSWLWCSVLCFYTPDGVTWFRTWRYSMYRLAFHLLVFIRLTA